MSGVNLLSAILDGGIQNVNFVNGRVLTAEDMTAERRANLLRLRLLGRSVGDGVDYGLKVTRSPNSIAFGQQAVQVTAGLALNRNGDMLQLGSDAEVTLTAPAQAAPANAGLFAPCAPPQTQLTNPGIYVLTIMPASGFQDQVPVVQLSSAAVSTSCSSRFATAGVQFRLQQLTLDVTGSPLQSSLYLLANQIQTQLANNASIASVAPSLSQLQNGLAYACFGVEQSAQIATNPLSTGTNTGVIQLARTAGTLTNCEVPLALLYWTPAGIQFIDTWAVRRSIAQQPFAHVTEAEAMRLQFENQMQVVLSNASGLSTISADAYFLYLPPAGMVQTTGNGITAVTTTSALNGFDLPTFFGAHASQDIATTNGNLLRELLADAVYHEPIQLANTGEIQLYLVWENLQAVNSGGSASLAVVFSSGALRYRGIPRFATAKWSLSRFAPRVI